MADSTNGNSSNPSTGGGNSLEQSPWGRLKEVLSDEEFSNLFSGVGGGEGSTPPSGGGGGGSSLGTGSPFTRFGDPNAPGSPLTGGVNPWATGNQGGSSSNPSGGSQGGSDPLTGGISTSKVPNGLELRVTIDSLVNSKLKDALGDNFTGGGNSPVTGGSGSNNGIPSFGGSDNGIPSFGGSDNGIPSFGGNIPSFGS